MLLVTLGASLLINLVTWKDKIRIGECRFRAVEGTVRVGENF